MVTINLKKYYPDYYKEDTYMDVEDDVAEFLETNRPKPASAKRKAQRYKAQYSLDAGDGIEEDTLVLLFEEARRNELLYERLRTAMTCLTEKQRRRFLMKYDFESEDLWNEAHKRLNSRKRESKSGFVNIFAGLLKCDKCGYALCISNAKGSANYFVCNTYSKKGTAYCTSHYTLYDELYEAVLTDIRHVISCALYNKEEFVKKVLAKIGDPEGTMTSRTEQEIRHLEGKIADLEKKFDRLYDDRLEGILSDRKFRELSAKCEAEQDIAAAQLAELKTKLAEQEGQERDIHRFVRLAEEYGTVTELDADMLNHLVSRIVVGERVKDGDTIMQKIKVEYKFIGIL